MKQLTKPMERRLLAFSCVTQRLAKVAILLFKFFALISGCLTIDLPIDIQLNVNIEITWHLVIDTNIYKQT